MSITQNFFRNIIGIYAFVVCCLPCVTMAVSSEHSVPGGGTTNAPTFRICPENYYVATCGSVTIGTNLLKGILCAGCDVTNYYDYAEENNMENLRAFFDTDTCNNTSTVEYIFYTDYNGTESSATSLSYCDQARLFLDTICTPNTNSINTPDSSFFTCLPCPNDGNVGESVMGREEDGWKWSVFHTIADCYKDTFEDSTGTYVYGDTEQCHYATEIKGDTLVLETSGTTPADSGSTSSND